MHVTSSPMQAFNLHICILETGGGSESMHGKEVIQIWITLFPCMLLYKSWHTWMGTKLYKCCSICSVYRVYSKLLNVIWHHVCIKTSYISEWITKYTPIRSQEVWWWMWRQYNITVGSSCIQALVPFPDLHVPYQNRGTRLILHCQRLSYCQYECCN